MEGAMAGLFQVLWGEGSGKFKEAAALRGADNQPLMITTSTEKDELIHNICARPTAVDWNGDGKLDLIVGNMVGQFYLFEGEGKGRFAAKSKPLMGGGQRLQIDGHHGDPFVVDWDGDGDLDIVSGSAK